MTLLQEILEKSHFKVSKKISPELIHTGENFNVKKKKVNYS